MTGQNAAQGVTQVTFDLSWENSWRLDSLSANNNWDAAWVFVKYRLPVLLGGDGVWKHAKLTETGHKPGEGMQAAGGLLNPAAPFDIITNPALGVFIYRSIPGEGSINLENVELRWHYASAGLKDIEVVEIEVYAIEMVYVPRGGFFVGSGGTETESFTNGSWVSGASIPLEITSENALRIAKEPAAIWSTTALGISGSELPSTFPKGYEAFYIMKYSVSHGQYVEFLNTLTESQATTRSLLGENQFRHSLFVDDGIYRTDLPFVAKNYLSWSDGAAYLDWAGLRPMTELEYEKASRGTAVPVANEFAWGNTTIKAATTIVNSGAANETTSTAGANAVFSNRSNVQGPIRVGAFATTVSNRQPSGASFWGVMELSGNLWERTVSVGDEAGRDYTGQHGDGLLTELGNANVPQWPGQSIDGVTVATGTVIRGGAWISPVSSLRISDRIGATQPANSGRLNTFGLRGVRSSPTPIDDKTPVLGSLTDDAAYQGGAGDGADANRTAIKNLSGLNLKIWTGGTPGNTTAWFAGANWFDKAVPGADDPILIPTTANQPVISGTSPGNDILKTGIFILQDGTSLTLEAGPVFTLGEQTDLITEGSASVILEPGSTYLNLSRSNPNLEVKQTISGEKGWRMLGVPVKDAVYRQFLSGLVSQGFSESDYPGLQPNVLWFDETDGGTTLQGWRAPSSVDAAARLGRGHYVYVFNGATIPGRSGAYADTLPVTLNVKGIEHNLITDSSFTFSVTYTPPPSSGFQQPNVDLPDYIEVATLSRGFNLVANPTASVIDFFREEAWTKKNLDNSIYIWDPAYGDGPRKGGWRTYNGTSGNLPNGLITPYQAFWVRTNAHAPELVLKSNLAKSTLPSTYLSRLVFPDQETPEALVLDLAVTGEGMQAESWINFEPNGRPDADPNDSYQLESLNDDWLLLYSYGSQRHQIPLQINNLDPLGEEEKSIPLMLAASLGGRGFTGQYRLTWRIPEQWPEDVGIVLMDHHQQKAIDMRSIDTHDFRFKAPETTGERLRTSHELFIQPGPVIFKSPYISGDPTLRQTTGNPNMPPFTIRIGRTLAEGPLAYKPDIPKLLPPVPNPFQSEVFISFYIPYKMNAQVVVFDLSGRIAKEIPLQEYESGTHQISWSEQGQMLGKGVYIIQLITENAVDIQKLIKN